MQLYELKRNTPNKKKTTIGRGGKRGKTSGRGHKGQRAHGDHGVRPEMRDIIKRIPKLRGYGKNRARTVNSGRVKPVVINLSILEKAFKKGEKIDPTVLIENGIIKKKGGKVPVIKILGVGNLTKSFTITNCLTSRSAKEKIEKTGGSIIQKS